MFTVLTLADNSFQVMLEWISKRRLFPLNLALTFTTLSILVALSSTKSTNLCVIVEEICHPKGIHLYKSKIYKTFATQHIPSSGYAFEQNVLFPRIHDEYYDVMSKHRTTGIPIASFKPFINPS